MRLIPSTTTRGQRANVRVKRPSERRSLSRSATRALDVLEFFGDARRPLRAVEISKMLGMHPSTTNQLLKTMVDSAHLVFDAHHKTYLPSPRLVRFSAWLGETYALGGHLRELIQDVHARTNMVVTLTTPNDLFMQVIDVAVPMGHHTERGLMISIFGSAIGSAYLSTLDEREVKRLALRARIPTADIAALLPELARIRQQGYIECASTDATMWSIAMPLSMTMSTPGLRVPTVLGLAGPSKQVRENLELFRNAMSSAIAHWIIDPATHQ